MKNTRKSKFFRGQKTVWYTKNIITGLNITHQMIIRKNIKYFIFIPSFIKVFHCYRHFLHPICYGCFRDQPRQRHPVNYTWSMDQVDWKGGGYRRAQSVSVFTPRNRVYTGGDATAPRHTGTLNLILIQHARRWELHHTFIYKLRIVS